MGQKVQMEDAYKLLEDEKTKQSKDTKADTIKTLSQNILDEKNKNEKCVKEYKELKDKFDRVRALAKKIRDEKDKLVEAAKKQATELEEKMAEHDAVLKE